jgi:DNA-binding transcriptional ArsR family regulator
MGAAPEGATNPVWQPCGSDFEGGAQVLAHALAAGAAESTRMTSDLRTPAAELLARLGVAATLSTAILDAETEQRHARAEQRHARKQRLRGAGIGSPEGLGRDPNRVTRRRRALLGENYDPGRRFVPATPLRVLTDWRLTPGARLCCFLIVHLAKLLGDGRVLHRTTAGALAAALGVTPRTVRNYYRELEREGYIERSWTGSFEAGSMRTTITLADKALRREPGEAPADAHLVLRLHGAGDPELRDAAAQALGVAGEVCSESLSRRKVVAATGAILDSERGGGGPPGADGRG